MCRFAKEKVQNSSGLELLSEPQSVAVCFRYKNSNGSGINAFNMQLRENLRKSGRSLINYGYWNGDVALRYVAANPESETEDIDLLFDNIFDVAKQLEKE